MEKIKTIVVEDVSLELKGTLSIIRNDIPEVEVIGTAQTEREFWALIDGGAQPDLVLLDLGLGGSTTVHLCQHLVLLAFILVILIAVKWYLIVVLICISLMANDIKHLFICLCAILISYLSKCLFKSFAVFHLVVYFFLLTFESSLYSQNTILCWIYDLRYFKVDCDSQ